MKTILCLIMLTIIAPIVLGQDITVAGSDFLIYESEDCKYINVEVNGTETIDAGEYSLLGCEETETDFWKCTCDNGYDLIVSTELNTINNYTFKIEEYRTKSTSSSSSSGGGGGSSYILRINDNETKNAYIYRSGLKYVYFNEDRHSIRFKEQINDTYVFEIRSDPITLELQKGENKTIKVGDEMINIKLLIASNTYYLLEISNLVDEPVTTTTTTTTSSTTTTTLEDTIIDEPEDYIEPEDDFDISGAPAATTTTTTTLAVEKDFYMKKDLKWLLLGLGCVLIIILLLMTYKKKKKGEEYGDEDEGNFEI